MGESILCNANAPPAVILSGGLSRRMAGGDKSFSPLARRPMLAHVVERLTPQTAHIVISANGDLQRFAPFGLPVVGDVVPGQLGPLAGILSGMLYARENFEGASHIASIPCDVPFLPWDFLARLVETQERVGAEIIVAACGERWQPALALWPVSMAPILEDALTNGGTRRLGDWVRSRAFAVVDFPARDIAAFLNVNGADELAFAEHHLASRSGARKMAAE
jgi:molybdopterin-guanine dinucleotide biosynthesis protein A